MPWKCRPNSRIVLLFIVIIVFLCTILLGSYLIVEDHRLYEPIPMKMVNVSQCYRQPSGTGTAAAGTGFVDKTAAATLSQNSIDSRANGGIDGVRYFEDILDSKWQPTPGKTIFFHETSCSKSGIIELNAK